MCWACVERYAEGSAAVLAAVWWGAHFATPIALRTSVGGKHKPFELRRSFVRLFILRRRRYEFVTNLLRIGATGTNGARHLICSKVLFAEPVCERLLRGAVKR